MKTRTSLAALWLPLLALGLGACRDRAEAARLPERPPGSPAEAAPPVAGETTEATPAAEPSGVAWFSGETRPRRRSTMTPRVAGAITRVYVREGDSVKKGDPLVGLDTEDFSLRVDQAEAALRAARVALDAARLDWERTKALLDDRTVPQSQFEAVDARHQGAKAAAAQAQVAVQLARKQLADAVVRAPYAAVVTRRHVSEGEYAAVMPPTSLVTIEEIDTLDLRLDVPAGARVGEGAALRVRFPATGQELVARVARVVPSLDPRTRTFPVIAEIPNATRELRPGLFAQATLAAP
jgi:RND family efflux transporter MFP subunit